MKTDPNYKSPKLKKISAGTLDELILESLTETDAQTSPELAEALEAPNGSIGSRLAVLTDNGYVDREKIDGIYCYSRLKRKRSYDPHRRWSANRLQEALMELNGTSNTTPTPVVQSKDVTPSTNKFDDVIEALTKANSIDNIKQEIRKHLSDIDDLLAQL